MRRFEEKVVIVTGAGSGIGRASALAFAREGAQVVVADVNQANALETVAAITAADGKAISVAVDVADSASVKALVAATVSSLGRLDVYFSNAGAFDGANPLDEISDELWARVVGVNLSGCFYGARAALPHLVKSGGNVVITASIASLGALGGGAAYTASKHGVVGLINQLACEFAPLGVRINGVAPGGVRTAMIKEAARLGDMNELLKAMAPLGRLAEPEEIAAPVLFLASSEASYITGTLLRVDGGWRSK